MSNPIPPTPPQKGTGLAAKLTDPRAATIPCPVLRTLANEDLVHVSPEGNVDAKELKKAFKAVGVGFTLRNLLVDGGKSTQASGFLASLCLHHLNLYDLRQGPLMHSGDSKILRDGFNQQRLDALLAFSSDGQGLTVKDLAKANQKFVEAEPGSRGHAFGVVELSALICVFGEPNAKGEKALSKDALVSLFRDNKLPADWKPHHVGPLGLVADVARFTHAQRSTPAGHTRAMLAKATGGSVPLDSSSLQGLRKAMCPAYRPDSVATPPTSPAEVAVIHNKE